MKKENFEKLNFDYPCKQKKDEFGDFKTDFSDLDIFETKKVLKYLSEKKRIIKEHYERFEFDFSEDVKNILKHDLKCLFDKYFKISGDFMIKIELK